MFPEDRISSDYCNICTVQNQDETNRNLGWRHVNEILQVITLIDVWLFLPCPLFFLISEEREVSSPQRSKWYFRPRSSWECGWAGSWLLGPVEDRRCSDGSALWGRPGTIRDGARRPPDANSQRHDFYSGCSHSRSLANSISAAPFCRWEAHLPIYPTKTDHLPLCYKILSLLPSPECCLPSKNLFSVTFFLCVRIWYARHKSECWPHLPSANLPCWLHMYTEG